jgi:putative DNA primase/helicase
VSAKSKTKEPSAYAVLTGATKPYPERGSADLREDHREYFSVRAITDAAYLRLAGPRSGVGGELIFLYYDPATDAFLRDFARVAPFPRPKKGKFKQPAKSTNHLYFVPIKGGDISKALEDPSVDLYIAEGETRALALGQRKYFATALGGIYSFRTRTSDGRSIYLSEFDLIELKNRTVIICLDHDVTAPDAAVQKRRALVELYRMLEGRGAKPRFILVPALGDDKKTGLDDYIAAKGDKAFEALLPGHDLEEDEFKEWSRLGIYTDRENADRFARSFANDARYVPELKRWVLWNGNRWIVDIANQVWQVAMRLADDWRLEAVGLQDSKDRARHRAWADECESLHVIKNAVALAASDSRLIVHANELDRQPLVITLAEGAIDLETGKFHKNPERDWFATKHTPIEYDPKARCPRFEAFLARIVPDRAARAYLQRVIGYALTGDMREQCFFIWHGETGQNGKGTLNRIMKAVAGEYYVTSELATWERQASLRAGGTREDLMALRGARVIVVNEPGRRFKLNTDLIKTWTGEDPLSARAGYERQTQFDPEGKLFYITNHKPDLDCDDPALWRRPHYVPFDVRITEKEKVPGLANLIIKEELPGILNWAITGARDWLRGGLAPPKEILAAVEKARTESDRLGDFLEEDTEAGDYDDKTRDFEVAIGVLHSAYVAWCNREGVRFPLSKNTFSTRLAARGFEVGGKTKDKKRSVRGLQLTGEGKQRAVVSNAEK